MTTNLPGLTVTGSQPAYDRTHRVQLRNPAVPGESVVFHVMPSLSESGTAGYRDIQPNHTPGGFSVYMGSSLRTFMVSDIRLLARTESEAIEKLRIQNLIRGWTKPYFGRGNSASTAGLPPDVLILSAYGSGNIGDVPVVLKSYTIDYPSDSDYLYLERTVAEGTADYDAVVERTAVPIVSTVTLDLQEVRSMHELNNFSLEAYKAGSLTDWA